MDELLRGAPRGTAGWVCGFDAQPGDAGHRWAGRPYNAALMAPVIDGWVNLNTYVSVASLRPDADGQIGRTKDCFARLLALVVDDMDDSKLIGDVSWSLETSPGNRQMGIFLDGSDPDCADLALIDRVMAWLSKSGLLGNDVAGNNAARYVRLLIGTNNKERESGPWRHRVRVWQPRVRMTLEDAVASFGGDLDAIRAEGLTIGAVNPSLGPGEGQAEKIPRWIETIVSGGPGLHDSMRDIAASMLATGSHPGLVTSLLRGLGAQSGRRYSNPGEWQQRMNSIEAIVRSAERKFKVVARFKIESTDPESESESQFDDFADLESMARGTVFVVADTIEANALTLLYGSSGSGKSFIAISLGCSVGTGTPWFGKKTTQGPVFIIIGEGKNGILKRIRAWEKVTGVKVPRGCLFISKRGVALNQQRDASAVSDEIHRMSEQYGVKPAMVIIDTLARNFGDGDENSAQDMGEFINNVSNEIRAPFECAVVIVHHSGHGQDRARGSSSLRAAMDAEYQIKKFLSEDGGEKVEMTCTKMKDDDAPPKRMFKIKPVVIREASEDEPELGGAAIVSDDNPFDMLMIGSKSGTKITAGQLMTFVRGGDGEATTAKIQAHFDLTLVQAREVLAAAVAAGMLEVSGAGRGRRHSATKKALDDMSIWLATNILEGRAEEKARAEDVLKNGPPEASEEQEEDGDASQD